MILLLGQVRALVKATEWIIWLQSFSLKVAVGVSPF